MMFDKRHKFSQDDVTDKWFLLCKLHLNHPDVMMSGGSAVQISMTWSQLSSDSYL